jgi:hypothetical protein
MDLDPFSGAPVMGLLPSPPASPHSARTRAAVVMSSELLEQVLLFLAGGTREARADVGRAAGVCRLWRDVALENEVWGQVAQQLVPVIGTKLVAANPRKYLVEQGKSILRRSVWVDHEWWGSLHMHVEVWDGCDGLRMLSAEGPVSVSVSLADACVNFYLKDGDDRHEAIGPPFSARSRGTVVDDFGDVEDYFTRASDPNNGACINMRVGVHSVCMQHQVINRTEMAAMVIISFHAIVIILLILIITHPLLGSADQAATRHASPAGGAPRHRHREARPALVIRQGSPPDGRGGGRSDQGATGRGGHLGVHSVRAAHLAVLERGAPEFLCGCLRAAGAGAGSSGGPGQDLQDGGRLGRWVG